jgi:peptidase C25-like protein/flagellar hook capping protein FlgD
LTLRGAASYNRASTISSDSRARGNTLIRPGRLLTKPQLAILTAAWTAFLAAGAAESAPPSRGSIRAAAQDLRGATFEYAPGEVRFDTVSVNGVAYARVSVGGAVVVETPGRPSLPTATIHVAVPDGMSPRVKIASEQWNERAGPPPPLPVARQRFVSDDPKAGPVSEFKTEPDPAVYARPGFYPWQAVEVGQGAAAGEMWVVPVRIHPVRWDPAARAYRTLAKMSVRVDFVPATDVERAGRPSFRPGGDVGAWRHVQEGLVRNFQSARSFPLRPKSAPRPAVRARRAVNPEFRIAVTSTGWTAVNYAALSAAGFPTGIPINTITLSERGYDDVGDSATFTPIQVVPRDNNFNGVFDAQDLVTFYGQSLRDRMGPGSVENRYTDANVYWLTWNATPAAPMDSISGSIPGPATIPASFLDTIHLEQNIVMLASPNPTVASPPEAVDYFFWTNGDVDVPDVVDEPIPFVDPDVSQPFRIRSYYQGQNNRVHRLNIFYQSSTGVTDTLARNQTFFNQDVYALDTGATIPGSLIGAGSNRYQHVGDGQSLSGGPFSNGSRAWLDWIEVTYSRLYRPRGQVLQFTSGGSGSVMEIHVGNFGYSNIEVYDVTVPTAPKRVTDITINSLNPPPQFEAVFRTDATAGERRFVALIPNNETIVPTSAVSQDTPSALGAPGPFSSTNVARSIIISPRAFLTPANRLADFRRAQGYVVEVADVQDVYDEYNGGIKSARAIRRYLRHAYLTWTPRPTFVVLAGDASMDYKHHLATSGVDWIPTYMQFEPIAGPGGAEVVAHDSHYSLNLAAVVPGDSDFVPSIFLARIPAGNALQLDDFVTKVVQYENFQPGDTWRGRMMLLSDDEYSTGLFAAAGYCLNTSESLFRDSNQDFANSAAASQSGQDLRSDFFDLKTYSDPLATTCQSGADPNCRLQFCVDTAFRVNGGAVDQFHAQLGPGALILNVEAHANRYLIAHELIYATTPAFFGPDYPRLTNYNRPAFFMVWGCHANQFADGPSQPLSDSLDALGEEWLLLPNRGSIGSLGSSAYEFLNTNSTYNHYIADAFFTTPPVPTPPTGEPRRARWILGEVLGEAALVNGTSGIGYQSIMNRTINLLGDPMLRMDALPPRVFEVKLGGTVVADGASFTSDSPTDSVTLVAKTRDEAGVKKVTLAERDVASGNVTPVDTTLYTTASADTGRLVTLTTRVRPRVGNYDLQVRGIDGNDRLQIFSLQVRTPVRYLANGVVIVNGVFVENSAVLRAEVTTPIPVTADSLALYLDGTPISITKTKTDGVGRQWVLESLAEGRGSGTHVLQIAVGGRTAGFDQVSYQVSAEFTMRGVAVVSPHVQGAGCGGSIFQYELSGPANRVELLLMTVAGRRVSSIKLPGGSGLNVYCWDGRDSQGHDTATGLYLFRIRATDASGRTVSQDGRMIRSR